MDEILIVLIEQILILFYVFDFENKNILVTGGTRGIGREIAKQLLLNGGNVTVTGTKNRNLSNLRQEWGFSNLNYLRVDFLEESSVANAIDWIRSQRKIDILINNAGINIVNDNINTSSSEFDFLQMVNLKGPYVFTREVSKVMSRNSSGKIVNITSIWGVITRPGRSLYSASKFGLLGLTKGLATDLAKYGILVNSVAPGFTKTELTEETNSRAEILELEKSIPVGRFAEPIEIAFLVLFLVSEMNTYITGQNIIIDGGYVNV